ncbi:MAG: hypothetical protein GYA16_14980, partial [Spirochaetes bacterium]|nr:hypothetical protein [Spirochaetota bacterium]
AKSSYSKLQELTVAKKIDLNFDEYYKITMQERAFSNKRIEQFINELKEVDASISNYISGPNPKNRLYFVRYNPVTHTPVNRYGTFTSEVALENESLEFLAFGHPVIDFCIEQCQEHAFGGLAGIKRIDCPYDCSGLLFHYLVTLKAKEEVQRIIPVFVSKDILNQSIIDDIEQETLRQYGCAVCVADDVAREYSSNIYHYYELSLKRLEKKVGAIVTEIKDNMNLHIDPYMERVCQHYQQEKEYLHKRLEWQECQQKWYGKDMQSAITRTKNMIQKIDEEHHNRLKQYSGFTDVTWNASLVNAGILVCTPGSF